MLAIVDMIWGTVLCSVVSIAGYLVASRLDRLSGEQVTQDPLAGSC